ncbi:MAG: cell wall metabolism sensor histidine kinase WalK [Eubacterium sp.]|nr:cell wall metabolism sensor histidine kinase WalK [Eubacterium sp.]
MKHSIRVRLILIVSIVLLISIACVCVANIFLLPNFYLHTKISQMDSVYEKVVGICEGVDLGSVEADDESGVYDQLDGISGNSGVSLNILKISADEAGTIANITYVYPTGTDHLKNTSVRQLEKYVRAMYFGEALDDNFELLKKTENHEVYNVYDDRIKSNYIELTGQLPDDYWIYMRANLTGVTENAAVSNRFLIYVGIVVLLISIGVTFFIARSYTRPILKLAGWAKEMRSLNFSTRYEVNRTDEIGVLGRSMNDLSDELENTISELKTANNRLTLDIERKTEQEQMRQEFLANVSHELKTPIALIRGYAEGLQENINDDQESRDFYCEVIIDEADKMNQMVKKLLSLNQLEFGENQVQIEHFDIRAVIEGAAKASEIVLNDKNVELRMGLPEEPVMVWADEYMIEEVVTNYLSNAINHVENDGIIEIKSVTNDEKTRISVFNTGNPIPEEDIDKIWNKFYKVDKARTREYGGNGIGLSIVKAVMDAHNQRFGVNNYDNGVEFWFELDVTKQ